MAISGSLEDVGLADVLRFIALGRRTGTLELARGGERARLGFVEGALVSAQAPGARRLGELLLAAQKIDLPTLQHAVARQAAGGGTRSLGQVLVEMEVLPAEEVERLVQLQLERAVEQVMSWESGSFDFTLDEVRPVDDIGVETEALLAGSEGVESNVVLLEAVQIFEDRGRRPSPEETASELDAALGPDETQDLGSPEAPLPSVRVLTSDRELARRLRAALAPVARVRRVELGRACEPPGEGETEIVLVDARAGAHDAEGLTMLRAARPEVRLVILTDSVEAVQTAYREGAVAAVPADAETVRAAVANLLAVERPRPAGPAGGAGAEPGVRRLQRVLVDLRSGLSSATVALNLMQAISESFERAVLFLAKRERLAALGAFGSAADGRPLAVAVRRLELAPEGALRAGFESSELQSTTFAEAALPTALAEVLGPPVFDQVVVFPVAGVDRVIALVYADNGDLARPIRDVELLEVAAAQVGIAFENELLRRQLSRSGS